MKWQKKQKFRSLIKCIYLISRVQVEKQFVRCYSNQTSDLTKILKLTTIIYHITQKHKVHHKTWTVLQDEIHMYTISRITKQVVWEQEVCKLFPCRKKGRAHMYKSWFSVEKWQNTSSAWCSAILPQGTNFCTSCSLQ